LTALSHSAIHGAFTSPARAGEKWAAKAKSNAANTGSLKEVIESPIRFLIGTGVCLAGC
jgi:hypothetical protein